MSHAERLRQLGQQLAAAQEAERHNIARELHDSVCQNLTGLLLVLAALRGDPAISRGRGAKGLADAEKITGEAIQELRDLMVDLRPPMLDDAGLVKAMEWYAGEFTRRTGIQVEVLDSMVSKQPDGTRDLALFRIVQEALTNVAKHAHTKGAEVVFSEHDGMLDIAVVDHGCGFPPGQRKTASWGLLNMQERALAIGGQLSIDSAPGQGTRIQVSVTAAKHPHG